MSIFSWLLSHLESFDSHAKDEIERSITSAQNTAQPSQPDPVITPDQPVTPEVK